MKIIENKIIIITGSSGKFGSKIVDYFLSCGAIVVGLDIRSTNQKSKNFHFIKCNITNEKDVSNALSHLLKRNIRPNVLINNAGVDVPPKKKKRKNDYSFEKISLNDWNKTHNVNINGVFICSKIFGEFFSKMKDGVIINISSIYGIVSPDNKIYDYLHKKGINFFKPAAYTSSKSSLTGFTKYLGVYWAKKNVRVNCLVMSGIQNNQDKAFLKAYNHRIPIGRMANADDYFGPLFFLISDMSKYMTGSILIVDGGWTAI